MCTVGRRGREGGGGGASSGARVVKVYFWMYSLRSERLAVGARQLWRQHVIVARQPDRPKKWLS